MEENGVDEIIKSLPSYLELVNIDLKRERKLQFNTRNTIPWKLECERKGLDREYGLRSFKIVLKQDKELVEDLSTLCPTAFVVLGFFTFSACWGGGISILCTGGFYKGILPMVLTVGMRLAAFLLASIVMLDLITIS